MMHYSQVKLRPQCRRPSRGFTLVETLVAIGILSVILGLIGQSMFQTLRVQRTWQGDVLATRALRNTISWFSRDAPNAISSNLADGAAPAATVTLEWPDSDGAEHTATYNLVDGSLVRNYDGAEHIVARNVSSVAFARAGDVLKVTLAINAPGGGLEAKSLDVYARRLE